jgi:hypothetical protein
LVFGDQLVEENLPDTYKVQPTAKLAPKRHGLFKVTRVMSAVNYHLELPTQWSIHPVFHIDLLTPYHETSMHGANYQRPPPDLVGGEEEYEVETVLASRRFGHGKKLQYLVKWKGYPDSDNQWINKEDVFADDAIREFKSSNPDQETHIRRVNIDSPSHHSSSRICQLPGPSLAHSQTTASTLYPEKVVVTLNSASFATSPHLMQENTTASVESSGVSGTTITDNWALRNDSIISTSTVSSVTSQPSSSTSARTHYSFMVEDIGGPTRVGPPIQTDLDEESVTAAESPHSVSSEIPIAYYVYGQEALIPFSITNEADIVIGPQENQIPIPIPPPGDSPAIRQICITPSSRDSPAVQTLINAALVRIRASSSTMQGGAFFEDDVNDITTILSLANSLRDPNQGTQSEDDVTAGLMSQLNQVRRPCSPTPVIRRSQSPATFTTTRSNIPISATSGGPVFSPPSRGVLPESDAPQRRRTHGHRGQGGTRVSMMQPLLPVSGLVSLSAESLPPLVSRLAHPPPPLGFERNIGRNYVPCLIPIEGGCQVPATYTRLIMSMNPQVVGRREGDTAEYGGPLHAQPDFDVEAPHYTPDDVGRFKANAAESEEFDAAWEFIHDRVLTAEVYRFRQSSMAVTGFKRDIELIQERMWEAGALMEASGRHLEGANALSRIEDASDERRRRNMHIQQQAREYEEGTTNRRCQHRGRRS